MKQKIITITGASCSGKTTFQEKLINEYGFANLVSSTTRPKREGEVEGKTYYFVSKESFEQMIERRELTQSVFFSGNYYGVTNNEAILKSLDGAPILTIVEPTGVLQYQRFAEENDWEFKSIYIDVDLDLAVSRMFERDKNMATFEERLNNLKNVEMTWRNIDYDIIIPSYNKNNEDSVCAEVTDMLCCKSIYEMNNLSCTNNGYFFYL